jgi:hypothetical protein
MALSTTMSRPQPRALDMGVFGGDLGLVLELLDALSGVGVGDVVRQLGGHDTGLDECHVDVGPQFLP